MAIGQSRWTEGTMLPVLFVVSAALIAGGLLASFLPLHAHRTNCGSAFVRNDGALVSEVGHSTSEWGHSQNKVACDERRGLFRTVAWFLLGGGLAVAVTGMYVLSTHGRQELDAG
ncbi:MAG: hypothetical protein QOI54_766 [Actinomycetota bacterium]|jgi:hypothetical protein|nr:hypothetical protein [Actinomycetota bacterium]